MAESSFDGAAFLARLETRRIGRQLVTRARVESTNDLAWEAHAAGAPDGLVVVADQQERGRGRSGRVWHTAPGKGLALSLLLVPGCDHHPLTVVPLACGLALARALERLGLHADLKWPNDLLVRARKVAGILVESRGASSAADALGAIVVGVGVNVSQLADDFPPELRTPSPETLHPATSLALEGVTATREAVAAEFLNALEPLWTDLEARGREPLLEAWRERASFWGERFTVRTAAGTVVGVARALAPDGGLVLERDGGERVTVRAGDLEPADPERARP